MDNDFESPKPMLWKGRDDGAPLRYFQTVQCLEDESAWPQRSHVLLGFASDEGVSRNLGRVGAKVGPDALKKALAGLALHHDKPLVDAGNLVVESNLEDGQTKLAKKITSMVQNHHFPIVLGGGHEVAFGHFKGLSEALNRQVAIVNFDAHFDLRKAEHSSSGTPFLQCYDYCQEKGHDFAYYCIGVNPTSNTAALYETAEKIGVEYLHVLDILKDDRKLEHMLDAIISKHDAIYVTVCLDVFSSSLAPGVSAATPLGLEPWHVMSACETLAQSAKVVALDIAELAPQYDDSNQTALLGATLIDGFIRALP